MRTLPSYVVLLFLLSACRQERILTKTYLPFHSEKNTFRNTGVYELRQFAIYDRPNWHDEGYWHRLEITIKDSAAALKKLNFKLPEDSLLVNCLYDNAGSAWNWPHENYAISGELKIISWKPNRIRLKLHLIVFETMSKRTMLYTGKRIFYRKREGRKP